MRTLACCNKFWVALAGALASFLVHWKGRELGLPETFPDSVMAFVTAALVWLVPNGEAA